MLEPEVDGFTHPYLGLTPEDRLEMLRELGLDSVDELFSDIPVKSKFNRLPEPTSEVEVYRELFSLSLKNSNCLEHPCFLGGQHIHYVPAVVQKIAERSEFLTSYTPYQPEISQGLLQALFEYQSLMAELTAMDVVNASHYTYGTSLGEAAHMAYRVTGRRKILVCGAVNTERLEVLKTYAFGRDLRVVKCGYNHGSGELDIDEAIGQLDSDTAMVYAESPNYFGIVEPRLVELSEEAHRYGSLFCQGFDTISLAIFRPPGEVGADIAVGEGVGAYPSYGGPTLGVFAVKREYVRNMPGRVVGATLDRSGRRGFVITLQTREQHIRKEKATSNITTNSAILALQSAIYIALMGYEGLKQLAHTVLSNTRYVQHRISNINGVICPRFSGFSYQDFVIAGNINTLTFRRALMSRGVIGPKQVEWAGGRGWLVGVNEMLTPAHVDLLVESLKESIEV
ncbi:MAG: aminomethyl-transferring glycine dehydrogenase subunit GcvPA [Thermoprotei archaeon]